MKINIEPNLQTSNNSFFSALEEPLVKINKLMVPIYQREYDWEQDEIIRLLSDLDNYILDVSDKSDLKDESYFTGAIILEKLQSKSFDCSFEVVDGQQRLTTLYLLNYLSYLITYYRYKHADLSQISSKKLIRHQQNLEVQLIEKSCKLSFGDFDNSVFDSEEENEQSKKAIDYRISAEYLVNEVKLRLEISDDDSNDKLKEAIISTKITEEKSLLKITTLPNNRYGENIEIIFNHIYSSLMQEGQSNEQILEAMHEKLELYLKYAGAALIVSENKDDSFKLFEVLNDTARKLTVLDLLKNYFVEKLGNNYSNDAWKDLKSYENNLKSGVNLINDLIKSEGFTKTTKEYSYLSNKNPQRSAFFKNENIEHYFSRLLNLTINLSSITKYGLFNKKLTINSLQWNLAAIHSLKFHWGRQTMLAIFNLQQLTKRKKGVTKLNIWESVEHRDINRYEVEEQAYLVISDLLIKIGIISKVNNLSSKVLPEMAQKILERFITLISENGAENDQRIINFITDVKGLARTYFDKQNDSFSTNLKSLRYTNSSHQSTFRHLLFFLYNKGENAQYHLKDLSLEHIEPQNGEGTNYFVSEERDSFVHSLGNMVLIGQSKNSAFSNMTVQSKLRAVREDKNTAQKYQQDAFINHPIFSSLDLEQQVNKGQYPQVFELLRSQKNYQDGTPTEMFFTNRMKFYDAVLKEMIFNDSQFLMTGLPYPE